MTRPASPNGEDAVTELTRSAYVPRTPEAFIHDADGNLTADARWRYTWDAENRLVAVESAAAALAAGVPRQKLEFAYDGQARRVAKKVFSWNPASGLWNLISDFRFLYDGWNLLAEFGVSSSSPLTFTLTRSFVWGLDLSGSLQGAGGVGGLLFATNHTLPPAPSSLLPCFDGNGNVTGAINAADGTVAARFDYNAFGETLVADGSAAGALPFRFSTKYTDDETGLLYYGYRYYQPSNSRWLSRDPLEEPGGANLYGMAGNAPTNTVDFLGLWTSMPFGGQHDTLTRNSLQTAFAGMGTQVDADCRNRIAKAIVDGNLGQDSAYGQDLRRHFNRAYFVKESPQEIQERRTAARNAYSAYLRSAEASFNFNSNCWARLETLGRLSHSWQDYYGHGIHTNQGFIDPITGSPEDLADFWPSSYHEPSLFSANGEHNNVSPEPASGNSRRFSQAEEYVTGRYQQMLEVWMQACRCACREGK
jgi:RHS repeat-associated protein